MNLRRWGTAPLLGLAIILGSCDREAQPDEPKYELRDGLPEGLSVAVREVKPSFDGNWEVVLLLENFGDRPIVLENLKDETTKLVMSDGTSRPLHGISLGRAKPVKVRAGARHRTSLLFTSSTAQPVTLVLKGRELPTGDG